MRAIFEPFTKEGSRRGGKVGTNPALTDLLCMGDNGILSLLGVAEGATSKGLLQELVSQMLEQTASQEFSFTMSVIGISS